MSNVERMGPDYYRSYSESKIMANKIQSYWHNKGFPRVRVWVEEELSLTSDFKNYNIRSNIQFDCKTLMKDLFGARKN